MNQECLIFGLLHHLDLDQYLCLNSIFVTNITETDIMSMYCRTVQLSETHPDFKTVQGDIIVNGIDSREEEWIHDYQLTAISPL